MNALDLWDIHTGKRFPFDARAPRIDNGTERPSPDRYVSPAFAEEEWDKVFAKAGFWQGPPRTFPSRATS
jgi:hypothetical protein